MDIEAIKARAAKCKLSPIAYGDRLDSQRDVPALLARVEELTDEAKIWEQDLSNARRETIRLAKIIEAGEA